jgi:UDP-2,3-diacylglucosamine pyrophosphatase LpxH
MVTLAKPADIAKTNNPKTHRPADDVTEVRALFISDLHLGFADSHADKILETLRTLKPKYLYLVGDIIDEWRLRKSWYWNSVYSELARIIWKLQKQGTKVYYTPGNHDHYLRHKKFKVRTVKVADEFVHTAADGRKFLVIHGDAFDSVESKAQWLSTTACSLYDVVLKANNKLNRLQRRLGMRQWKICSALKCASKAFFKMFNGYVKNTAKHARQQDCDGVICGHVHAPEIQRSEGTLYLNTGDWVENRSILVEKYDGSWELIDRGEVIATEAASPGLTPSLDEESLLTESFVARTDDWGKALQVVDIFTRRAKMSNNQSANRAASLRQTANV